MTLRPDRGTRLRSDADLALPDAPAEVPALGPRDGGLAIACAAGPGRLLVEGGAAAAVGTQRGPLEQVRIGGWLVASDLEAEAGAVANLVAWPGLACRERIGPDGVTFESTLASATLPLVAVQWEGPPPRWIELALHAQRPGAAYRVGPRALVVADEAPRRVALAVAPTPRRLSAVEEPGAALRVRVEPSPSGPTTLLLAAGTDARVRAAFAAAPHLAAHARIARRPPFDGGLKLRTGVAQLDDGVEWARCRLRSALARAAAEAGHRPPPSDPLWATAAALGVGDREAALAGLEALGLGRPYAAGLLAARFAMTFGEAGPALERGRALLATEAGSPATAPGSATDDAVLRHPCLEALAEALRWAASDELVRRLRAAAAFGTVRGHPGPPDRGRWLSGLLAGDPPTRPPDAAPEAERRLYDVPARFGSDPDAAWALWRGAWDEPGTHGAPGAFGPGAWDGPDGAAGLVAPVTSSLLLGLTAGLLGLAPDAHVGLVRIAPRFPAHLRSFRAEGITVGSSRLTLSYEREGGAHRFSLEPTAGAVPATVIFAPRVAGVVAGVRVDGQEAELDLRTEPGHTVAPVKLAVDATRTVEIVTG